MHTVRGGEGDEEHEEPLLTSWSQLEVPAALLDGDPFGDTSESSKMSPKPTHSSREYGDPTDQSPLTYIEPLGPQLVDEAEAVWPLPKMVERVLGASSLQEGEPKEFQGLAQVRLPWSCQG